MWIPSVFRAAVSERSPNVARQTGAPGVLVVTADDKFYYLLLSLAIDLGWGIRRARNLGSAAEQMTSHPMPIVVYDERLPYSHWRDGLRALSVARSPPVHPLSPRGVSTKRSGALCSNAKATTHWNAPHARKSGRECCASPGSRSASPPKNRTAFRRGRFQSNVTSPVAPVIFKATGSCPSFVKPCEHRSLAVTTLRKLAFSYTEGNAMLTAA